MTKLYKPRSDWTIIYGPPGTGKTSKGMSIVENALSEVDPEQIGYLAFTRKAAEEAKTRAISRFGNIADKLYNFRTIHSFCFSYLGLSSNLILNKKHYKEIAGISGVDYSYRVNVNEDNYDDYQTPEGNKIFFLLNLCHAKESSLKQVFDEVRPDCNIDTVIKVKEILETYKKERYLYDFNDLLYNWIDKGLTPELDTLFVDEGQDLSKLQWRVIHKLSQNIKYLYVAGDDDQAIYNWAGGSVDEFLGIQGEKIILNKSYRLPLNIKKFSDNIAKRISNRQEKDFDDNGNDGRILYYSSIDDIDMSVGTWYLLARNKYMLKQYENYCVDRGYSFISDTMKQDEINSIKALGKYSMAKNLGSISGYDIKYIMQYSSKILDTDIVDNNVYDFKIIDYPWTQLFNKIKPKFLSHLRNAQINGDSILKPRIRLSTIHAIKGGEADNVVIMTDLARRSWEHYEEHPDDEHRLFYVGCTRAKQTLHILEPRTKMYYPL